MHLRILIYFIYIIIFIFSNATRISYSRHRNINNMFGYTADNNEDFSVWIAKKAGRMLAVRKCKKFLKKKNKCYTLSNRFVTLIYDSENKIIYCKDKTNRQNISNYDYIKQEEYYRNTYELFDETFDTILTSFNENANYYEITNYLNQYFTSDKKDQNHKNLPDAKLLETSKEMLKTEAKKIDINKANAEELSQLPGISIIIAKKIIKCRHIKGEFTSIEDFYKEMKIKVHFQKQLNDLIFINKDMNKESEQTSCDGEAVNEVYDNLEVKPVIESNNERIIDI